MAAAIMRVTPTGAGAKTGADWANAMGEAEFETDIEGSAEAGDIYYLKGGTYTLDSTIDPSLKNGSTSAPISIIGVASATTNENPAYTDWASGADRPLLNLGSDWLFKTGNHWKIFNLIFQGQAAYPVQFYYNHTVYNCKFIIDSTTSDRYGLWAQGYGLYLSCEFCGTVAGGKNVSKLVNAGLNNEFLFCYFHDCRTAFEYSGTAAHVLFCAFQSCSVAGISIAGYTNSLVLNNSFNDCATAITGTAFSNDYFINNLLEACTTDGIKAAGAYNTNFYFRTHGNDTRNNDMWDGPSETTPHMDPANTSGDPLFTADGNLSLGSASPCIDTGLALTLGVG